MNFLEQILKKKQEESNARMEQQMSPLRVKANQRLEQQARTGTIPTRTPGFGVRKPEISQAIAYNQNKQNIMWNGDKTQAPKALPNVNLNQGITAGFRNLFDSNSPVDQVNRAREGRAVSYRQSELDRGNMRPMENIGQQLAGNTARLVNTAGQAIKSIPQNNDVSMATKFAEKTGDNRLLEQVLNKQKGLNQELSSGRGGILNAGNFLYNNEKDLSMSTGEALKRSGLNTLGTASEVLPFKINPLKTASLGTRLVANAGVDAGLGVGESASRQYLQTGKVDTKTLATDSIANAVMGVVPTVAMNRTKPTSKLLTPELQAKRNALEIQQSSLMNQGRPDLAQTVGKQISEIDQPTPGSLREQIRIAKNTVVDTYKETKQPDINPSDNDLFTLTDYGDLKMGNNKQEVDSISRYNLTRLARQIGDKYGVDVLTGSPQEIQSRITDFVEAQRALRNNEAGFINANPNDSEVVRLAKTAKKLATGKGSKAKLEVEANANGTANVNPSQLPQQNQRTTKNVGLSVGEAQQSKQLSVESPSDTNPLESLKQEARKLDADIASMDKFTEKEKWEIQADRDANPYVPSSNQNKKIQRAFKKANIESGINAKVATQSQPPKSPLTVEKVDKQTKIDRLQTLIQNSDTAEGARGYQKELDKLLPPKPTLQDALEGKSTKPFTPISQPVDNIPAVVKQVTKKPKVKPIVSDSSLATSPELSVSSPRNSGQQTSKEILQTKEKQLEMQKSTSAQSLVNNTPKTREVKLNTDRLNPDSGYAGLAEMNKRTTEVVDTLSNKEVQSLAKDAGIDTVTHSPEQIKKKIAEQLNVRQDAVRYMNEAEVARKAGNLDLAEQSMMKAAEAGRISRSQGSELGQQLQARRIIANQLDTPQQRIFKLLDTAGINPETYVNRLRNVDFTDPKQVVEAYRDLVPAKGKDWIDVVRYNSMLSSPLTHAVNAMSNTLNVGVVAPLEKTLRGVSDAVGGLFGKERKYASGEGIAYMTGGARKIKKAADEFMNVLSGKSQIQNLDLNEYSTPLATKGVSGATYKTLSVPTKLLGASDKFFRTIAEAGEENALKLRQRKGIKVKGDVRALAEAEGSYRLFQQDTDLKGQGALLSTVDSVTNSIMQLRNKHMVFKFVFPFVKTPSNILKQGIEFSPLGAVNLIGNADKATALTRMAIGTAVFGTAASMVASGDMTWGEPRNAEARDRFRAEGRQPYSIRIGGKWIAFNKLPPAFSYPMALTAGIHDAVSNGDMTEETGSRIFEGIAKYGQFLSDQSYAKNIGDTLNAFKGDPEKAVQAVANYPQQLIPFRALTGWVARMSDDTERRIKTDKDGIAGEIDKQVQALMQQYPFLRQKTGTRDYEGTPIPSNNPVLNAFSPIKITDDRGTSELDTIRDEYKTNQKTEKAMKESLKTEKTSGVADTSNSEFKVDSDGKVYANIDGEVKTFETKELYDKAVKKAEKQTKIDDFVSSGEKTKEIDGVMYLKSDDNEQGYTTKSKDEFKFDKDMQGVSIEIDKAKANNDLDAWIVSAEKKYNALVAKRDSYDKDTEFDKIDAVNKQLLDLDQEFEKYDERGYIRKGGKGGKGSKSTIAEARKATSLVTASINNSTLETYKNLDRLLAGGRGQTSVNAPRVNTRKATLKQIRVRA